MGDSLKSRRPIGVVFPLPAAMKEGKGGPLRARPRCSPSRLRLQAVPVVSGLLCVAGGREDRPLIIFQNREPTLNIRGVILARLQRDAKIGTEKRRADLGNEFFHCITGIGKTLAA